MNLINLGGLSPRGRRRQPILVCRHFQHSCCAETLFFDYYRQYKLRIKAARIFNTYGPRMHPNDGRVVSIFIGLAKRILDWTTCVALDSGLSQTIACFRDSSGEAA